MPVVAAPGTDQPDVQRRSRGCPPRRTDGSGEKTRTPNPDWPPRVGRNCAVRLGTPDRAVSSRGARGARSSTWWRPSNALPPTRSPCNAAPCRAQARRNIDTYVAAHSSPRAPHASPALRGRTRPRWPTAGRRIERGAGRSPHDCAKDGCGPALSSAFAQRTGARGAVGTHELGRAAANAPHAVGQRGLGAATQRRGKRGGAPRRGLRGNVRVDVPAELRCGRCGSCTRSRWRERVRRPPPRTRPRAACSPGTHRASGVPQAQQRNSCQRRGRHVGFRSARLLPSFRRCSARRSATRAAAGRPAGPCRAQRPPA